MMKTLQIVITLAAFCIFTLTGEKAIAQVSVDHPIQLTGSGANAKVTGIQSVTNAQDATNVATVQNGGLIYAADQGTANAYVVGLSPAAGAYTPGMIVNFIAANANTGASNITVNNLGTVTIKKQVSNDLAANDIRAGQAVSVIYDGTYFQMLSELGNAGTSASHGKQRFTSNGTFTAPSGVDTVWVSMSGGGGGGGGGLDYNSNNIGGGAGGGGADAVIALPLAVSPGTTYNITVGAGGTGGAGSPTTNVGCQNGNNGTGSSFGALATVNGGSGGSCGSAGGTPGGAAGGSGGQAGYYGYSGATTGGSGGNSLFGAGGNGGVADGIWASSNSGSGYGGGGGGGYGGNPGSGSTGASGSAGFVLVEW